MLQSGRRTFNCRKAGPLSPYVVDQMETINKSTRDQLLDNGPTTTGSNGTVLPPVTTPTVIGQPSPNVPARR
jgi:hypothetical protein